MSESIDYKNLKEEPKSTVYVIQEIAGTKWGTPKINIIGASRYGKFKFLLPEMSQIIFSPGLACPRTFRSIRKFRDAWFVI